MRERERERREMQGEFGRKGAKVEGPVAKEAARVADRVCGVKQVIVMGFISARSTTIYEPIGINLTRNLNINQAQNFCPTRLNRAGGSGVAKASSYRCKVCFCLSLSLSSVKNIPLFSHVKVGPLPHAATIFP